MNAGTLYSVIRDVESRIRESNIQGYIISVIDALSSINSPNVVGVTRNNILSNAEKQIVEILGKIPSIIPNDLTVEENKIYSHLGYLELFGVEGEEKIKQALRVLYSNPQKVSKIFNEYQSSINTINAVFNGLSYYDDKFLQIDNVEEKNLIVLSFKGKVEINNLDELSKASNRWNQVLLGFALLTKNHDTNFRVESVERGSIILTISAVYGVVCLFAKSANNVLDVVKKYYEIRKSAADLKSLKMPALSDTITELESKAELKTTEEAKTIANELIRKAEISDEDRTSVEKAVNNSIQHLLEFVWNGGKVDVKLVATTPEDKEIEVNISVKHRDIKQLENKINELEQTDSIPRISDGEEVSTD